MLPLDLLILIAPHTNKLIEWVLPLAYTERKYSHKYPLKEIIRILNKIVCVFALLFKSIS